MPVTIPHQRKKDVLLSLNRLAGDDLEEVFMEAAALRDRHWDRIVTYSRKVFIPLTTYCRNSCGYCTFVQPPGHPKARYLTPDEVLELARGGRALGCKEALFSLGEKPERRHPEAAQRLAALGYSDTVAYLRDLCKCVLEETGLIPHANAGALSSDELLSLKPVCGSMGLMLENVSERLLRRGQPHFGCPDKIPARRLDTLEAAGRLRIPFTTGLLIGIGETWAERIASLEAIASLHRRYGHIQEVILQPFRAKPGIPMAKHPEPGHRDLLRTIAAARLLLDPSISIQAPPNLDARYEDYLRAGLNDWGGVSPLTIDHINPERPWPRIDALAEAARAQGFVLRERLTVYPRFLASPEPFLTPSMRARLHALAGPDGLARESAAEHPIPEGADELQSTA